MNARSTDFHCLSTRSHTLGQPDPLETRTTANSSSEPLWNAVWSSGEVPLLPASRRMDARLTSMQQHGPAARAVPPPPL
jgi:hypothetical protein